MSGDYRSLRVVDHERWYQKNAVDDCLELQQGKLFCVMCNKVSYMRGVSIVNDEWPRCCTKEMNLVPVYDGRTNIKDHPGAYRMYIRSLN